MEMVLPHPLKLARSVLLAPPLAMTLGIGAAQADARPTDGGLWSFAAEDSLASLDDPTGAVRVTYSVSGPNATLLDDDDADGQPDYPALVAQTAIEASALYESLTFLPPRSDGDALDLYLIDFGGAADGRFAEDGCVAPPCAGFLVIENDFVGYPYGSLREASRTVVSHELFHAVQAAYVSGLPSWVSEGTAVWAERQFDPSLEDFLHACNGYLATPHRPIYAPPPGPVPAFAYGTALWWDFLSRRHDPRIIADLLSVLALQPEPAELAMESILVARNDDLGSAWFEFARANVATGFRAGGTASHPYAQQLDPIPAELQGATIDAPARLFPLAASYWHVAHPGGPLLLGATPGLTGAHFSVHPVMGGAQDGVVLPQIFSGGLPAETNLQTIEQDAPPGGYWIVATLPTLAANSIAADVCVGGPAFIDLCLPSPIEMDTDSATDGDEEMDESSGCACAIEDSPGDPRIAWLALLAAVAYGRASRLRRRTVGR